MNVELEAVHTDAHALAGRLQKRRMTTSREPRRTEEAHCECSETRHLLHGNKASANLQRERERERERERDL